MTQIEGEKSVPPRIGGSEEQNWGPGGWAERPTLITRNPRPIELHVKRARKSLGRRATADELKAANVEMTVTYTKSLKAG
jgi:hypothetical protein